MCRKSARARLQPSSTCGEPATLFVGLPMTGRITSDDKNWIHVFNLFVSMFISPCEQKRKSQRGFQYSAGEPLLRSCGYLSWRPHQVLPPDQLNHMDLIIQKYMHRLLYCRPQLRRRRQSVQCCLPAQPFVGGASW